MTRKEDVLNRLWNCKFQSAYDYALELKYFPKELMEKLRKSAKDLGNCGWGGDLITNTANELTREVKKVRKCQT